MLSLIQDIVSTSKGVFRIVYQAWVIQQDFLLTATQCQEE